MTIAHRAIGSVHRITCPACGDYREDLWEPNLRVRSLVWCAHCEAESVVTRRTVETDMAVLTDLERAAEALLDAWTLHHPVPAELAEALTSACHAARSAEIWDDTLVLERVGEETP